MEKILLGIAVILLGIAFILLGDIMTQIGAIVSLIGALCAIGITIIRNNGGRPAGRPFFLKGDLS